MYIPFAPRIPQIDNNGGDNLSDRQWSYILWPQFCTNGVFFIGQRMGALPDCFPDPRLPGASPEIVVPGLSLERACARLMRITSYASFRRRQSRVSPILVLGVNLPGAVLVTLGRGLKTPGSTPGIVMTRGIIRELESSDVAVPVAMVFINVLRDHGFYNLISTFHGIAMRGVREGCFRLDPE